ncbi:hypothetical protein MBLNU13_g10188t1 [Cladosporium sp. NU13]
MASIDLTTPADTNSHSHSRDHARDHFTPLPPEVTQQIASYLFATHLPDKAYTSNPSAATISTDLLSLASTSKTLHQHTNNWAHHFLHQYRAITKYKDYKTPQAAARQRPLRELLQWSSKNCAFCGKKSSRSAILMNGLRCCRTCDREQWPEKITKTEAIKKYNLKEHQLLPSQHHAKKLLTLHPGLPMLRYGTYFSAGVLTTMFLKDDVEAFAELAHGDLKGHLKKREVARQERMRMQKDRAIQAAQRQLASLKATDAEVPKVPTLRPQQVVVIDDSDEDENEMVVEDDGGGDDLMFSETVVIEDD